MSSANLLLSPGRCLRFHIIRRARVSAPGRHLVVDIDRVALCQPSRRGVEAPAACGLHLSGIELVLGLELINSRGAVDKTLEVGWEVRTSFGMKIYLACQVNNVASRGQ